MSRATLVKIGLVMAASAALTACGGGGGGITPPGGGGGGGGGGTPSAAAQISSGFETIFNTASTGTVMAVTAGNLPAVSLTAPPIDF